jgi:REP element-mobilizing transposase RayT
MSEFLDSYSYIESHGNPIPHWHQNDVIQFVTFRLGDAMPSVKLSAWKQERIIWLRLHPEPWNEKTRKEFYQRFSQHIEKWLDQGHGSCLLRNPNHRTILADIFQLDNGNRATIWAWVIMPNHVHALFTPIIPMSRLIGAWKSLSARRIGLGSIWFRNYRDTMIRNPQHVTRVVRYIRKNPVKLPKDNYTLWESERAKEIV